MNTKERNNEMYSDMLIARDMPEGATHVHLNAIGQAHDWYKINDDRLHCFVGDWHYGECDINIFLKSDRFITTEQFNDDNYMYDLLVNIIRKWKENINKNPNGESFYKRSIKVFNGFRKNKSTR